MFGIKYDVIMFLGGVICLVYAFVIQKKHKNDEKTKKIKKLKIIGILIAIGFALDLMLNYFHIW